MKLYILAILYNNTIHGYNYSYNTLKSTHIHIYIYIYNILNWSCQLIRC